MTFLLIFSPVLVAMAWGLYHVYRKGTWTDFLLLLLITVMTLIRFASLGMDFSGVSMSYTLKQIEIISGLYIIPCTYMYLCKQNGTYWYNTQAIMMITLPLLMILESPYIDLGNAFTDSIPAMPAHTFNIYNEGHLIFSIHIRSLIIVIQGLTFLYCLVRLYRRVKSYGLTFSSLMWFFMIWSTILICALMFVNVSHIYGYGQSSYQVGIVAFVVFALILTPGFAIVPGSYSVAPIVTVDSREAVTSLDKFAEQNRHLSDHLHQLMEDDRIYLQPSIHIDDLAEMMGTNRTYVTRLMRQEFGQSFTDYVNNARIIYSKKLLVTTNMSIEEVANASGFQGAQAYSRVFKRITNATPSAWKSEQNEEGAHSHLG